MGDRGRPEVMKGGGGLEASTLPALHRLVDPPGALPWDIEGQVENLSVLGADWWGGLWEAQEKLGDGLGKTEKT